jgi:hypothetical protein
MNLLILQDATLVATAERNNLRPAMIPPISRFIVLSLVERSHKASYGITRLASLAPIFMPRFMTTNHAFG